MTLEEYQAKYGTPYSHIARQCGVTSQAISMIARGLRQPQWELAGCIERATRGEVPRSNWYPPEVGTRPPGSTKKRRK
jgi:DNA-binding transcriptional regulator YdaS (Cro superfamily)